MDLPTSNVNQTGVGMSNQTNTTDGTNNDTTISPLCDLNYYCESMDDYFDRLEDYILPAPGEWALIAVYILTFLTGLIGNVLVCFAIWRNRSMRTITNIFIANLSAADLAVIILCLPSALLVDVTETWFLGTAMCKINIFLNTLCISVSVLTLSAIAVERWYAICHPLQFHSTVRRARVIISCIWVVSVGVALPELISSTVVSHRTDTILLSVCYPGLWDPEAVAIFQICLMVALYFMPLCLMGFTYMHIGIVLWNKNIPGVTERRSRQPMLNRSSSENDDQIESRKKAAKMLFAVVVLFGLCFFPIHLLNILRYTKDSQLEDIPHINIFALVAHWATFLNSCTNPIVYNFMSDNFRKELKEDVILCFRSGRETDTWAKIFEFHKNYV